MSTAPPRQPGSASLAGITPGITACCYQYCSLRSPLGPLTRPVTPDGAAVPSQHHGHIARAANSTRQCWAGTPCRCWILGASPSPSPTPPWDRSRPSPSLLESNNRGDGSRVASPAVDECGGEKLGGQRRAVCPPALWASPSCPPHAGLGREDGLRRTRARSSHPDHGSAKPLGDLSPRKQALAGARFVPLLIAW